MTKEEAAHLSDVLKAYSEGKKIEVKYYDGEWCDTLEDPWFTENPMNYRIKPEPCFKKYDRKTLMDDIKKHGGFVIEKGSEVCRAIEWFDSTAVQVYGYPNFTTYDEFLKKFVWFDDRSSCGILYE